MLFPKISEAIAIKILEELMKGRLILNTHKPQVSEN